MSEVEKELFRKNQRQNYYEKKNSDTYNICLSQSDTTNKKKI